ncbi:hypothetical protein QYF36_006176 [Acer negundo]|nr:hypothetical protein QYF36_006176 [Acer negundo]
MADWVSQERWYSLQYVSRWITPGFEPQSFNGQNISTGIDSLKSRKDGTEKKENYSSACLYEAHIPQCTYLIHPKQNKFHHSGNTREAQTEWTADCLDCHSRRLEIYSLQ